MSMNLHEWKEKGKLLDVYGHPVFYIQHKIEKPTIAFLHGYPSASFDYYKVLPLLENEFSYVIHDHLGLDEKPNPK